MVKCKECGNSLKEVIMDVFRKKDGKTARDVPISHCVECNIYFADYEALSYE